MPNPASHSTLRVPKILKKFFNKSGKQNHSCFLEASFDPVLQPLRFQPFLKGTSLIAFLSLLFCFCLSVSSSISFRYWLDLKSSDIIWNMSDTGWIKAAIGSVFSSWLHGACVFVHQMAHFDTNTFLEVSHNFCLHFFLVSPQTTER